MSNSSAWVRLLPSSVVLGMATLGRLGYMGKAPGTNGSAAGLIWFTLLYYPLSPFIYFLVVGLSIYVAIQICGEAENRMFKRDPAEVILDEMVAIPLCYIGLDFYLIPGRAWIVILLGFVFFRIFDILKPFGIDKLQKLPGGLGVVVDDLAAAGATCLTLHIILFLYYHT